jgi:hypothetical protein
MIAITILALLDGSMKAGQLHRWEERDPRKSERM